MALPQEGLSSFKAFWWGSSLLNPIHIPAEGNQPCWSWNPPQATWPACSVCSAPFCHPCSCTAFLSQCVFLPEICSESASHLKPFLPVFTPVFCLLVKSGISMSAVAVCDLVPVICLPQLDYNAPGGRLLFESQIHPVSPARSEVLRVGTGAHYRKAPEEADCSAKAALALEQIVILRRGGTFCSV